MPFSDSINIYQLHVFRTVARHMSFSRAAEDMILSQPAVSMHVKHLEKTIGLPLFDKVGRRIRLTEAGEQLLIHAQRLFTVLQETSDSMNQLRGGHLGHLRVAADTTAGVYVVPGYLGLFRRTFPQVSINLDVINRATVIERLLLWEVDLAVIGQFPSQKELLAIPFLKNELVVIAWPDHPLASQHHIPLSAIAREPFLMREEGSGTRATTERLFADAGQSFQQGMELASNSAIKQAVYNQLGLAVVPRRSIELELRTKQLVTLDVQGFPLVRHWHIVHVNGRRLPPSATNFKHIMLNDPMMPDSLATQNPSTRSADFYISDDEAAMDDLGASRD